MYSLQIPFRAPAGAKAQTNSKVQILSFWTSGFHILGLMLLDSAQFVVHLCGIPGLIRVSKINVKNKDAGPGRLPLNSGRRDAEFAGVLASVASVAVRFVSVFIL